MILVDTSLWIEHLRSGHAGLIEILNQAQVITHSFVIGELSCGNLKNRKEILSLLCLLPTAKEAEYFEVMEMIESHRLFGRGLGWVDMNILASCLLSNAELWTLDKTLRTTAASLGISII